MGELAEHREILESHEALKDFLLDIDCLDELSEWANRFNLFEVLGISKMEIRHSNVLAWLLDPNENHGLGDAAIKAFFRLLFKKGIIDTGSDMALKLLLLNYRNFSVYREWHNIDLLLYSESDAVSVAIENKILSGEHDDQLERYRKQVQTYLPELDVELYIYLTPNGYISSDPDNWRSLNYGDILDILDSAIEDIEVSNQVRVFIQNYIDAIRRNILEDERLKELCQTIYAKHQKALDLIFEYRPDRFAQVRDVVQNWADDKMKEGVIEHRKGWDTQTRVRFKTPVMSEIIPDTDGFLSDWKTPNHYFYEVILNRNMVSFNMGLCLNSTNATPNQLALFDRIHEIERYNPITNPNWYYHTIHNYKRKFTVKDDTEDYEITNELDKMLNDMLSYEKWLKEEIDASYLEDSLTQQ